MGFVEGNKGKMSRENMGRKKVLMIFLYLIVKIITRFL
jgi:hypothetical protein